MSAENLLSDLTSQNDFTDDNDDEDGIGLAITPSKNITPTKRTHELVSSQYFETMQKMQHYKDDANDKKGFDRLDSFTSFQVKLAFDTGKSDLGIILLMHESENAYCANNPKKAVKLAKLIPKKFRETETINNSFLLGRMACYTACAYVGKNKLGKAWKWLKKAEYNLQNVEHGDDLGILNFCLGRFYREFIQKHPNPSEALRAKAVDHYEKSSFNYSKEQENGARFDHEIINPLVYIARIYLDSPDSEAGRHRFIVTEKDIIEAEKYLTHAKLLHSEINDYRSRCHVRLILCEASLSFRKAQMANLIGDEDKAMNYIVETVLSLNIACDLLKGSTYIENKRAHDFLTFITRDYPLYMKNFSSKDQLKDLENNTETSSSSGFKSNS